MNFLSMPISERRNIYIYLFFFVVIYVFLCGFLIFFYRSCFPDFPLKSWNSVATAILTTWGLDLNNPASVGPPLGCGVVMVQQFCHRGAAHIQTFAVVPKKYNSITRSYLAHKDTLIHLLPPAFYWQRKYQYLTLRGGRGGSLPKSCPHTYLT